MKLNNSAPAWRFAKQIIIFMLPLLAACEQKDSTTGPVPQPSDSIAVLRGVLAAPDSCASCHPNHYAEWQTSMHAYAMTDPVFFRLNEIGQQRSDGALGSLCVSCHAPIGTRLDEVDGSVVSADLPPLSANAIHCDVCHSASVSSRGHGINDFRSDGVRLGPIADPSPSSFHQSEFDPDFSRSQNCNPCHDIILPNGLRIEETAAEWDNSAYTAMGVECQDCHMPAYSGQAATTGPQRDNIHRHYFTGVDVPLVDFPGTEATLQAVTELLQNAVEMAVTIPETISTGESFTISISLNNHRTGHNIPSGSIFERQMWIQISLTDASGNPFFTSGDFDANFDLRNQHSAYVQNGQSDPDSQLVLFTGTALHGSEETLFFWEADRFEKNTIAPFEVRTESYSIPALTSGPVMLSVKLLFRSFPPYLLREIGLADLVSELPVIEMETFEQQLVILP